MLTVDDLLSLPAGRRMVEAARDTWGRTGSWEQSVAAALREAMDDTCPTCGGTGNWEGTDHPSCPNPDCKDGKVTSLIYMLLQSQDSQSMTADDVVKRILSFPRYIAVLQTYEGVHSDRSPQRDPMCVSTVQVVHIEKLLEEISLPQDEQVKRGKSPRLESFTVNELLRFGTALKDAGHHDLFHEVDRHLSWLRRS